MKGFKLILWVLTPCLFPALAQTREQSPNWDQLLYKSSPAVQTDWAGRYEHSEGVDQDYSRALVLYCTAARKGYARAQYQLGWMYAHGRGVTRDDPTAAAWFRLAAANGVIQAEQMLRLVDDPKQRKKAHCVGAVELAAKKTTPLPPRPRPAAMVPVPASLSPPPREIEALVRRLAPDYGLDPALVLAVIRIESGFRADAVSPRNAQGLMQLIPATAERFKVQDILDPEQNLRGGMAYLRWLLGWFKGDLPLALAGYNAGENAVAQYAGVPPYPETQNYVESVIRVYGGRAHPPSTPAAKSADRRDRQVKVDRAAGTVDFGARLALRSALPPP